MHRHQGSVCRLIASTLVVGVLVLREVSCVDPSGSPAAEVEGLGDSREILEAFAEKNTTRYEPTMKAERVGDGSDEEEDDDWKEQDSHASQDASEDALLEEEHAYFRTRDHDGDGFLNRGEFLRQLNEEIAHIWEDDSQGRVAHRMEDMALDDGGGFEEDSEEVDDIEGLPLDDILLKDHDNIEHDQPGGQKVGAESMKGQSEEELRKEADVLRQELLAERAKTRGYEAPPSYKHERVHPLPSKNALLFGKDWTARIPMHDGERAFLDFDSNKDGRIDWLEWKAQMFHEEPQTPKFRNGEPAPRVYDPSNLQDHEVNPEELEVMKTHFHEFDTDKDTYLVEGELKAMLYKLRDEGPLYPDGVESGKRMTDQDVDSAVQQMMESYDRNNDTRITLMEWMGGGGV